MKTKNTRWLYMRVYVIVNSQLLLSVVPEVNIYTRSI